MLIEGFADAPIPFILGINQDKYFFKKNPEYQNFENLYYDIDSKTIIMNKKNLN